MAGLAAIFHSDAAPLDPHALRSLLDVAPYCRSAARLQLLGSVGLGDVPPLDVARGRLGCEPRVDERYADVRARVSGVIDGRFDDRDALVRALAAHVREDLSAATDLHLLLVAYDVWGTECVQRFIGDYAFCLWDHQRRHLFCARDRFGIKPLYYARVGATLVVTNVLSSLTRFPGATNGLDDEAVGDFLLFGFCVDTRKTLFAGVSRVPAGHHLTCAADGSPRLERYWTLEPQDPVRYRDPREYVERFSHELRVAVRDRLRDERAGVLMSGGLDSSSIAATAADVRDTTGDAVHAFTAVYDTLMPDEERRCSSLVADALRIPIHHLSIDRYETFERWDADALPPEPSTEPLIAATVDLWTTVGAHARVLLTGDGGDSALLPSTLVDQLTARHVVSGLSRTAATAVTAEVIQSLWRSRTVPPLGLRSLLRRRLSAPRESVPPWLARPLLHRFDPHARWEEVSSQRRPSHVARGRALADVRDPLWPSTFESYDPGATRVAVEPRYPFFDVRLVSFALTLPSFPWCVNKEILRSAMRGRLPDAIRLRRKTPLAVDPAVAHHRWSRADTVRLFEATPAISQYVDVARFVATLRDDGLTIRAPGVLPALALAKWLHCSSRQAPGLRPQASVASQSWGPGPLA